MQIKTIQEVARMGGQKTAQLHKGKHALWGRKGAKKRWAKHKKSYPQVAIDKN